MAQISLSRPDISKKEVQSILEVLKTADLSLGPKLQEFEEKFAEYIDRKYAITVNSGTSALHLVIRSLDIRDSDEVITTPFSFIASSNCILFERAKPVFVDICSDTLNINPALIEKRITKKTKAILAVDVFGHPANWDEILRIARRYKLKVIEDSCEALGTEYKGRKCGSFGNAAAFAFYPNKQITTGEGGMITTDNEKIAELCKSMRNQGRGTDNKWFNHMRLGYNYRISDVNCALGIAQMERINEILVKRAKVAKMYNDKLKEINEVEPPYISPGVKMGWFVYVVKLNKSFSRAKRDKILVGLRKKDIECSNYFAPIHLQPFYRKMFGYKYGDFPITESISERTIALPFYNDLEKEKIDCVVRVLEKEIAKIKKAK